MRKKTTKKTVKAKTASKAKKSPAKKTSVSVKAHHRNFPNAGRSKTTRKSGNNALLAGVAIAGAFLLFQGGKKAAKDGSVAGINDIDMYNSLMNLIRSYAKRKGVTEDKAKELLFVNLTMRLNEHDQDFLAQFINDVQNEA